MRLQRLISQDAVPWREVLHFDLDGMSGTAT